MKKPAIDPADLALERARQLKAVQLSRGGVEALTDVATPEEPPGFSRLHECRQARAQFWVRAVLRPRARNSGQAGGTEGQYQQIHHERRPVGLYPAHAFLLRIVHLQKT